MKDKIRKYPQRIAYNHLGLLSKELRRFTTYLNSQRIPYKLLAADYDSPDGTVILKTREGIERYFRMESGKLMSFIPYEYGSKKIHDFMPISDEI